MPVATEKVISNGKATGPTLTGRSVRSSPAGRRRQVPWIVAGVVLVVGCALAFAVSSVRMSSGQQVLAVARSVPAGQALTAADLRPMRLSGTAGLSPVPVSGEASVLGRPAAVALVPGTLLTPADLGSGSPGALGRAVVALALKAGAFPPTLGAGDAVAVVPVAVSASGGGAPATGNPRTVQAVVVAVESAPAGSSADAVVSLQVDPADAALVAQLAAAGQAALVQLPVNTAAGGSGQ